MPRTLRWLAVMVVTGCAHQREELTAAEHRNAAALEEARAEQDRNAFDPLERREQRGPLSSQLSSDLWVHDGPEQHLAAASAHQRQAHEHLEAAQSLEKFEDAACQGLSAAQRAACPMFNTAIERVDVIEGGVRLAFKPDAPVAQIVAQMRCHLAYAKAQGFSRPSCPLYMKGVDLQANGRAVDVVSADSAVAAKIRTEAKAMFGH